MLEELFQIAKNNKEKVFNDDLASEEERELAEYCYKVYSDDNVIKEMSKRDILSTFVLMGEFDKYSLEQNIERYNKLMEDVNKTYNLVDKGSFK